MEDLPPIGLGTMGISDPAVVETAIDVGYRHLDTAQIYENEDVVGEGVARAVDAGLVEREDLFVATKVWATNLAHDDVLDSTEESLARLGLDTIDLLYVHRPIEAYDPAETLAAFDRLRETGTIRHVGLSNFEADELETARRHLDAPVFAHQVEYHPLFRPEAAVADARAHDTHLVGYSPIASGKVFEQPAVSEVAAKNGVSEAAVSLAWLRAKGVTPIPKASSRDHLEANLAAGDLELDEADVERIDAIEAREELFPE